jgi:hypothetical protein
MKKKHRRLSDESNSKRVFYMTGVPDDILEKPAGVPDESDPSDLSLASMSKFHHKEERQAI